MKSRLIAAFLIILFIVSLWVGAFYIYYFFREDEKCLCENNTFQVQLPNHNEVTMSVSEKIEPIKRTPPFVKAVYMTGWSAGNGAGKLDKIIDLIDKTEINAVVIDVKDSTGVISFKTGNVLFENLGTEQNKIPDIKNLIQRLREKNIYAIGRIAVFEDPELASKKPELALKNKITGKIWRNSNGIAWVDPASKEVWEYNISLAKEAIAVGFDEINFDYIRFPSDGNISNIKYPFWDGKNEKYDVIRSFFEYLNKELKASGVFLSADLFGQTLWQNDGLNIGQRLADAAPYFDIISPMIYPSHFPEGFFGFQNPAEHPYEIIFQSLINAQKTLMTSSEEPIEKLESGKVQGVLFEPVDDVVLNGFKIRPWLQDFDMGANYNEKMIRLQKKAVQDVAEKIGEEGAFGWSFWNAANNYTEKAFDLDSAADIDNN